MTREEVRQGSSRIPCTRCALHTHAPGAAEALPPAPRSCCATLPPPSAPRWQAAAGSQCGRVAVTPAGMERCERMWLSGIPETPSASASVLYCSSLTADRWNAIIIVHAGREHPFPGFHFSPCRRTHLLRCLVPCCAPSCMCSSAAYQPFSYTSPAPLFLPLTSPPSTPCQPPSSHVRPATLTWHSAAEVTLCTSAAAASSAASLAASASAAAAVALCSCCASASASSRGTIVAARVSRAARISASFALSRVCEQQRHN